MKKAIITGATGYVGSNLAKRLVNDEWSVHVLVRESSDLNQLESVKSQISVHQLDGSTQNLIEIMQGIKPDIVFHLASLFIAEHKSDDVISLIESNIEFGTMLLESMSKSNAEILINTGTTWQHYLDQVYNPVNLYAATKEAFESVTEYYVQAHKFKVITLKLSDTYGPNDPRGKLVNSLFKIAGTQATLNMSPGEQEINLTYIDDVVDAFLRAAVLVKTIDGHKRYSIVASDSIRLRDLVKLIEEITNETILVSWGSRSYRVREVMRTYKKGEILPGWHANYSLRSGLKQLITKIDGR